MAQSQDFGSLQSTGSLGSFFPSTTTPPASLLELEGVPPELFKNKVDPQFLCGLCRKVLRLPMQTSCGSRFCYGCLYRFIGDKKGELNCPACDDTFDTTEIARHNYPKTQLEKAIVFCPNKDNGCQKENKLKDLDVHLEGCPFQILECLHKARGCTAIVLRGNLAKHVQQECLFRLSKCEFCDEEFPAADLEAHEQKCSKFVVECPNQCSSKRVHKDKVDHHVEHDCPMTIKDCSFQAYGCTQRCSRQEMNHHEADALPQHLQYIVKWQEETRHKWAESQRLIQEVSNNRGIMETKVDSLSNDFQALQVTTKKNETHVRETQKMVAKHSDQIETLELQVRQSAKKEEVIEMKKTMFKPLQEKQDLMDDRLKRLERGGLVVPGGGGNGSGGGGEVSQRSAMAGEGFLRGEIIRYTKINNNFETFKEKTHFFTEKLLARGYNETEVTGRDYKGEGARPKDCIGASDDSSATEHQNWQSKKERLTGQYQATGSEQNRECLSQDLQPSPYQHFLEDYTGINPLEFLSLERGFPPEPESPLRPVNPPFQNHHWEGERMQWDWIGLENQEEDEDDQNILPAQRRQTWQRKYTGQDGNGSKKSQPGRQN